MMVGEALEEALTGEGAVEGAAMIKLACKWGPKKIELELPGSSTVGHVRSLLQEQTRVPQKRQKLVGLGKKANPDDRWANWENIFKGVRMRCAPAVARLSALTARPVRSRASLPLDSLQLKNPHSFMMIGAPDEFMMLQASQIDDMPEVIQDLDPDYVYDPRSSNELIAHSENKQKLEAMIKKAEINVMNPPRPGKNLLVLDLDHTLLHFKDHQSHKRPHTIEFLRALYPHYDLCVWSQTKWIYIEHKLQGLGILGLDSETPDFKITFVLDKTSMVKIKSLHKSKDGTQVPRDHEVMMMMIIIIMCVRVRVRVCVCVSICVCV
jgi:ubiquitin-like domain-containing CTD phosphatase 1